MKIVLAEKVSPAVARIFQEEPGWTVVTADQIQGDLAQQVAEAQAVIVRSAVQADAALIEAGRALRVIGRAGVGVDNIDLDAATKAGIVVMNTPGANAVAVAEHTFGLMLSLARHLTRADVSTRAGGWEKKSLQGTELRGKTLGIIGLGRIGVEVAKRARAFEMKVVAHDPFVNPAAVRDLGIQVADLDDLYGVADYISLHLGITPQTQGMIHESAMKKMKKGVRLVNCARGELIDEEALAAALRSGQVGGAALDVFASEPPKDSPLLGCENLVATPHIAGSTHEAQEAVGIQIAQQVKEFLKRGVIQNAVNVPSVTDEEYAAMKMYLVLAEKLGAFLGQIAGGEGNLQSIQLGYSGRIAEWKTTLIRNAAVKGVLNCLLQENANLVNAAQVAAERGIRVEETREPGGVASTVAIRLSGGRQTREAAGTVVHGDALRLTQVDGIDIEAPLGQTLIYLRNRDVPGVIGKVGTITGAHGINIASFSLGRRAPFAGSEAMAVVQVDGEVPAAALAELRTVPDVTEVCVVRL
jgi:D-3-phosphoglycerate dehydrogenase